MPRQPPSPILHVRLEYEAAVQDLLTKHSLAPEIRRSGDPGVIELRFGQISDVDLLAFLNDLPAEVFALRAVVGGNPFDRHSP